MKRFSRISKALMLFVLSMPLVSGCWDRLDPENMAFIIAIGVDPGPKNDYLFTFAIAMPKSLSGGTGGGGQSSGSAQKKPFTMYTIEGSNIASALLASQSFISRRLTLIHSKAFIFGETMARKGVMPILSEVVRNREFRRTMYIMTTRGEAQNYINNIKPTSETDISLWFELELDPHDMGSVIPKSPRFHDFIMDVETPGTGSVTILTAPRPDIQQGKAQLSTGKESSDSDIKQPLAGEQYAGRIRRSGEIPVEFFGTAVYKSSVLAGFLTGSETRILNMLRGDFMRTTWDFTDPADTKLNLSLSIQAQKPAQIKVTRKNDRVLVTFRAAMEGDLVSFQSDLDYTKPENRKKLEDAVQRELKDQSVKLLHKTIHEWNTDCFRINNRVKTTFSTLQQWEDFKWQNHIKDMDYQVEVSFKMRRYGDQVGPAIEGDKL